MGRAKSQNALIINVLLEVFNMIGID